MCIALLLSVLAISPIMAQELLIQENQFSVSVLSSSGRPISGVQVYLANRDGIFQKGTADSHGFFVFEKPRHGQSYLLLAAPFQGVFD
jgi:hypothetical protein